ncbi:helix-turn-helix domain-containing protein [Amycolatopsis vancoresmycina]|uniref:XRE family transcriptional regulator n=1 Tax=Amycolatopsis vancoresmycina DSM 44592 TaxID=1292037 RepID=R1G801_9PSEU|nr:helix-turn-helix transcriptional regulator [Amycolatopsis vancoresmycina]EOD67518.1 XRE family transcriptional regulator [Amycolatopsis vancoresmycina DSM 44592]
MVETASPTVWRRWLAFELVRLRKEAGLEQKDVAKALRCTVAKVSYYETAERPVVLRDLDEVLLPLFKVPKSQWPDYIDAAKHSRTKGWWESYSEIVPSWFSLYVGLEQGANQVQTYAAQAVPGLLQTSDYVHALLRRGTTERTDDEIEQMATVRLARRAVLEREPDPLRLWAVLDEAVLRRLVGGREVMRGQLEHLVKMAGKPKITIQVLPFDRGAHPGVIGPFTVIGFAWSGDPGVAYVEHRAGGFYLEQPHEIEAHEVAFAHLSALALAPDESVTFIERLAEEYR